MERILRELMRGMSVVAHFEAVSPSCSIFLPLGSSSLVSSV